MPEHPHIEWKSSWRDEYLKWICGFAKVSESELRYEQSGLWVEFGFYPDYLKATTPKTTPKTTLKTTLKTTPKTTTEMILALIKQNPTVTRREMAESIGISIEGIKYHLNKLKADGHIRHIGSARAGRWELIDN